MLKKTVAAHALLYSIFFGGEGRFLALLSALYFPSPRAGTLTGYCPSADQNLCIYENLAPLPA